MSRSHKAPKPIQLNTVLPLELDSKFEKLCTEFNKKRAELARIAVELIIDYPQLLEKYVTTPRCLGCKRYLNQIDDAFSPDCRGYCIKCMADMGDQDCIELVRRIQYALMH